MNKLCDFNKNKSKFITIIIIILLLFIIISMLVILNRNVILKNEEIINKKQADNTSIVPTEAIYQVNSMEDDKMHITIKIKNNIGIVRIITPNGNEITTLNKKQIAIDYDVISGNDYIFGIELADSEKLEEFVLKADKNSKPEIKQNKSSAYPILTENGIDFNKKVEIDYGENSNNFYSMDNGVTWHKYDGTLNIKNECELIAKSIVENEISKEEKQKINIELSNDAITKEAYDNDYNTYMLMRQSTGPDTRYMLIDSSVQGKNIRVKWWNWSWNGYFSTIDFLDNNSKTITSYKLPANTTYDEQYEIPKNAVILKYYVKYADPFYGDFGKLYEIQLME